MLDSASLQYFCEVQARLTGVCVRLYPDGTAHEPAAIYGTKSVRAAYEHLPATLGPDSFLGEGPISLYDESQFILGRVVSEQDGSTLLIGPARMSELTAQDIDYIMNKYGLPKTLEESISSFLYSTPVMPVEQFLMLLSLFNLVVNGTVVNVSDILKDSLQPQPEQDYVETVDLEQHRSSAEYEEAIHYYIKNGMVEEIENLHYEDYQGVVGALGPNQMRSLKNSIIILNSMCLRAAISGGLDADTAYALGELYIKRIENAGSLAELGRLSQIIKRDYAQRVRKMHAPDIDNLYVLKATEYIQKHIYEKVSAQDLAKLVGITPEYLSVLFRETLHLSIPQWITRQKVLEAKKLLRFTEKSLAEIAALLNFSSQSYFQTQFKKIRGITPTEYREKYKMGIRAN